MKFVLYAYFKHFTLIAVNILQNKQHNIDNKHFKIKMYNKISQYNILKILILLLNINPYVM